MSFDRRNFLKLAGAGTLLGLAGNLVFPGRGDAIPDLAQYKRPLKAVRWAMVIDLRRWTATDAAACRQACHRVHNVPDIPDPQEEIKWIWTEGFENTFPDLETQHLAERLHHLQVPVLCNHCDNPPCVRVCPTQATWKRESDGIVMMDWHRCIGCRYCMTGCPYGSRSFNWRDPRPYLAGDADPEFPTRYRGVVEKCTFCSERLAKGLRPACVEACASGAMTFGDLADEHSEVRRLLEENFTIRRKAGLGTEPEVYYIV